MVFKLYIIHPLAHESFGLEAWTMHRLTYLGLKVNILLEERGRKEFKFRQTWSASHVVRLLLHKHTQLGKGI